jgi:hypothetical protein
MDNCLLFYRLPRMAVPVLVSVGDELLGTWHVPYIMFNLLKITMDRTESCGKDPEDGSEASRECGVGRMESPKQDFFEIVIGRVTERECTCNLCFLPDTCGVLKSLSLGLNIPSITIVIYRL